MDARLARPSAAFALALTIAAPPIASADDAALLEQLREGDAELNVQKQTKQIGSLDGIGVSGSLTGVVQQVNPSGADDGTRTTRANYRGDIGITLPGGELGDVEGKIFTHFRAGQGSGVTLRPTYTSTPNTTAFESAASPSEAYAVVAEAWYQLTVPLPVGGFSPQSHERLEFTFGKMDPFVFFDQNAVADDETTRFLNNAFVHNPLLDSGGDTGSDRYGFAPGVRIAYIDERDKDETWSASLGMFGSGPGADFSGSLAGPFLIGQVEATHRFVAGLPGTYRAYVWTNGNTLDFNDARERHTGFGFSIDQRVADAVTLWGRFGSETSGHVRFDRALTFGAEIGGGYWGLAADAIGLATGFLRTSAEYRDATADGTLAGYAASGTERIAELYYRWRINDHFDVTPDMQWIQRPGGDGSASDIFVVGVRARVGF